MKSPEKGKTTSFLPTQEFLWKFRMAKALTPKEVGE